MKCVDCHYLCAINGVGLPEQQRRQLTSRDGDAFTWLGCAKGMGHFTHVQPQVFDQVLQGRKCKGYEILDPSLTVEQMMARETKRMPTWCKVAIVSTIILGILTVVLPLLLR